MSDVFLSYPAFVKPDSVQTPAVQPNDEVLIRTEGEFSIIIA